MARRALKIATVTSTALLAVTAVLFLAGYVFSPWEGQYVSLTKSAHVGVWGLGCDSRIVFFNDPDGPYCGSIIGLVDSEGNVHPPLVRQRAFGDSWGIYYRYFRWSNATLWTLMVSLWYPLAMFAVMPMTRWFVTAVRRRSSRVSRPPQRPI
jgi:hypothetical protein